MPTCNTDTFQIFLEQLSEQQPEEFKIIVLDNGAFHKAKRLQIPPNIALLFLPPYSPELNPAEKIWWKLKRAFSNLLITSLEEISEFITQAIQIFTPEIVKGICGFEYIFSSLNWSI